MPPDTNLSVSSATAAFKFSTRKTSWSKCWVGSGVRPATSATLGASPWIHRATFTWPIPPTIGCKSSYGVQSSKSKVQSRPLPKLDLRGTHSFTRGRPPTLNPLHGASAPGSWTINRMPFQLTHPHYLVLLPLAWAWIVWLAWKTDVQISRWRRWLALGIRLVVVLAVVLALAGLQWLRPLEGMNVFFLLDRSDSIPSPQQEGARKYVLDSVAAKKKD